MGGTVRGQVALYVLIGVIVLVGVILAIVLFNQQEVNIATETPDEILQGNPDLQAEVSRMRERVERCLEEVAAEAATDFAGVGIPVATPAEAEPYLADEISLNFPNCFFRYNTREKLVITDLDEPRIIVSLVDDSMLVDAEYSVEGHYMDLTYRMSQFSGQIATELARVIERQAALDEQIQEALDGLAGDESFIDDDGYVDLGAFEDEGIFADMLVYDDGSCAIIFYDYNQLDSEGNPLVASRYYPTCVG